MPRLPVDYKKSLIYKLCCNNTDIKDIYIGSTTDFIKRKNSHKTNCNNPNTIGHNLKVYQFIRENNGWDNWSMILVENFSCESKLELKKRERHWIETLESKLNSQIPTRTKKEYRIEYADKFKKYYKKYRVENANKYKEQEKKKYEEHREEILEYAKEYRVKNKDKIKIKQKEKITCQCGCEIQRSNFSTHLKTEKHKKLMINK